MKSELFRHDIGSTVFGGAQLVLVAPAGNQICRTAEQQENRPASQARIELWCVRSMGFCAFCEPCRTHGFRVGGRHAEHDAQRQSQSYETPLHDILLQFLAVDSKPICVLFSNYP